MSGAGVSGAGEGASAGGGLPVAPRDDLALVEGYHSPQVDVEVRLNTNEAPWPPPPGFVDALADEVRTIAFNRYPDRAARELRAALAELHGVRTEQIFAANGSNEVIQCLLLAFGGPGRAAAVFEPTYLLHTHIAKITGTEVLTGRRSEDLSLDVAEFERINSAHRPAVTFICSPNNPTGRSESREVIEAVAAQAAGLVVVDEAYGQFARWSALPLVTDQGRVVVVRTFSKTWSMAANRLGYVVAPAGVVSVLEDVALPYHLDAIKQAAGRVALRFRAEMEARIAGVVEERGRIAARLSELDVQTWPSDANFVLFRPLNRGAKEVWSGLVERSVLVRDCSEWPGLEGCLRVTVGTPEENGRFLTALTEVLV
ncbi:MAG TPA: histidinol-phosphate transaminase [Acidimicrobiales bacterium]|nr:histidinol-phosphate transaminase [Acidimicrobiales bacterium]